MKMRLVAFALIGLSSYGYGQSSAILVDTNGSLVGRTNFSISSVVTNGTNFTTNRMTLTSSGISLFSGTTPVSFAFSSGLLVDDSQLEVWFDSAGMSFEDGETAYAARIRNWTTNAPSADATNTHALLVGTPRTKQAQGIIFHAVSQADDAFINPISGLSPWLAQQSRFIVKSDGKVGVNINAPTHKFHVAGDTRISGDLVMDADYSIRDPQMTAPFLWGTGTNNQLWGPKAFLNHTKARSLFVANHGIVNGRVTINDPEWTDSRFNVKEGLWNTYAARVTHVAAGSARGLLVNLPNGTTDTDTLLNLVSGIPTFALDDPEVPNSWYQNNITSRLKVTGSGRVGINQPNPFFPLEVRSMKTNDGRVASFSRADNVNIQLQVVVFPSTNKSQLAPRGSIATDGVRTYVKYGTSTDDWGEVLYLDKFTNGAIARTNIGLGVTSDVQFKSLVLTNSGASATLTVDGGLSFVGSPAENAVAATRANLGIGSTDNVTFSNVKITSFLSGSASGGFVGRSSGADLTLYGTNVSTAVPAFYGWSGFAGTAFSAGQARTNMGLGGGLTTNITVLRPSNVTNTLQFSNGILTEVTSP